MLTRHLCIYAKNSVDNSMKTWAPKHALFLLESELETGDYLWLRCPSEICRRFCQMMWTEINMGRSRMIQKRALSEEVCTQIIGRTFFWSICFGVITKDYTLNLRCAVYTSKLFNTMVMGSIHSNKSVFASFKRSVACYYSAVLHMYKYTNTKCLRFLFLKSISSSFVMQCFHILIFPLRQ